MTEKGIKVLRGEPLEPIKDNPVPSLDDLFKEFDKEENGHLWEYDSRSTVENFVKFCKEKLNGVETNKVQPKCTCYYRSNQAHWCEQQKGKKCKLG